MLLTPEVDAGLNAPALHPHVLHIDGAIEVDDEPVRTYDRDRAPAGAKPAGEDIEPAKKLIRPLEDGFEVIDIPETRTPYWLISNPTRRYIGPLECPDCGLGMRSSGSTMICPRLPLDIDLSDDHEGCVFACGIKR